jgi:hypothetical protein
VHQQILAEYPPDLIEDHYRLSALVVELMDKFKDNITIHLIDPQSLRGILKSIRHRVRKYPSFIIDGKELIVGLDRVALDRAMKTWSHNP